MRLAFIACSSIYTSDRWPHAALPTMSQPALAVAPSCRESPAPSTARMDSSRTSNSSYATPTSQRFPSSSLPSRPSSSSPPSSAPTVDVRDSPSSSLLLPFSPPSPPPPASHSSPSLAVRRRRKAEADKHRRMLDRRTVIDVKKIRADRDRGKGGGAGVDGGKAGEGGVREREEKAEALLSEARGKEEERRRKREGAKGGRLVEEDEEDGRSVMPTPASPAYRRMEVREEAKEQLTMGHPATLPETFLTSTHDLQSPPHLPLASPFASSPVLPSPAHPSSSTPPPPPLASPTSHPASADEGLSAYHAFINSRVQHMLVSNGVFIPHLHDHLVNTPHNAALAAATHPSSHPCTPPTPQFHLPSLQPPRPSSSSSSSPSPSPHLLAPSSASIALASPDERALYHLLLFLSHIPLLSSLPLSAFFPLARLARETRFDEFEVVANEGEHGDCIYIVKDGRVDTKLNLERFGGAGHATSPPASPRGSGGGGGGGRGELSGSGGAFTPSTWPAWTWPA